MKRMTIVTDRKGKLVGAVFGDTLTKKRGQMEAQVSFPPDYKLHKVELVKDDTAQITDPAELHKMLLKLRRLLKHTLRPKK
jgi:hypothetical protein